MSLVTNICSRPTLMILDYSKTRHIFFLIVSTYYGLKSSQFCFPPDLRHPQTWSLTFFCLKGLSFPILFSWPSDYLPVLISPEPISIVRFFFSFSFLFQVSRHFFYSRYLYPSVFLVAQYFFANLSFEDFSQNNLHYLTRFQSDFLLRLSLLLD